MPYDEHAEPTHAIPEAVEKALTEAKDWYDRRQALEATIRETGGFAERNQEDRDELDREGAELLEQIVEAIDETWSWGPEVGS